MKKPVLKARQMLSFLLCCLVVVSCLALPASSAANQDEETPPADSSSVPEEDTEPSKPADKPGADEENPGENPEESETPDDSQNPDEENPPEDPEETEVTVRFDLGGREETITLVQGQHLTAEQLPTGEDDPEKRVITGWLNQDGYEVDPLEEPILEDAIFTARWGRKVDVLLKTDSHDAYIKGYPNGMFKPQGNMTRAEAVTLLNGLLREKTGEIVEFADVKPGDWFAQAVSEICTLGLAKGYDNGCFYPNRKISRAEFVKMAISCDTLESGAECPFPDVGDGWEREYVASAYAKGWISGDSEGNFYPNNPITREEAVKIINNMLGRSPDKDIKSKANVKNFCDVFPEKWSYGHIVEASTSHSFQKEENGETWTDYTKDNSAPKVGWLKDSGKTYYVGKDGKFARGALTIDGKSYRFNGDGSVATGFFQKDGWTRYYKDGLLQEDISSLGVVKGPYYIKVYKPANYLIIFAKDEKGKYTIPVRSMLASCGNPTPTGTYYTPGKYRWLEMVGGSWAQWCTQILDSYLFHSVPNDLRNNSTMWVNEYNLLGTTRSLGCIRLNCRDAKWMYDNCQLGTEVYISPNETSGPMPKPAGLKLPAGHSWDPTDPTAYWMCQRNGCH